MTVRTPLVLGSDGLIQQLQSGDSINVGSTNAPTLRSVLNGEGSTNIIRCAPVYSYAAGTVRRAAATSKTVARVVGLMVDATLNPSATGFIIEDGVQVATTAEWDAVTGDSGGLTYGADYFVSATTGQLTKTPPTTVGQCVTIIGTAISTTELALKIGSPILL